MVQPAAIRRMSAAEYLAWEREQPERHEFAHGEVFAMAGGSKRHAFLCVAVTAELRASLRAAHCRVFSSDMRVAAAPGERYVYPDAVVECGSTSTADDEADLVLTPAILGEVLSPSTEAYDRGEKWELYQRLASLTDYLLISQFAARIEHFRRDPDGGWKYRLVDAGGTVTLANGATLAVDAIYQGAFELPAA